MVAGIDHQCDIDLYLNTEEMGRLAHENIESVLIKTRTPQRQGIITISINNTRNYENGSNGIGLDDSKYWKITDNFQIDVFLGLEWYEELLEKGRIGTRHSMRDGSKINIYNLATLEYIDRSNAETLEFYRANKDRLKE